MFDKSLMRFLAGALEERGALRWVIDNFWLIRRVWFVLACISSVLIYFWLLSPSGALMRIVITFTTEFAGLNFLSGPVLLLSCVLFGAVAPVLLLLVPVVLVAVPLLMFGAALWSIIITLGGLLMIGGVPFLLVWGGRQLFFYLAANWLLEADKREQEERAVLAYLGFGESSLRQIDGKARRMDADEFARLDAMPRRGAVIRMGKVGGQWFDYATEKHLLVVASTRGGKGRDLIVPNLRTYPGSVFVLDPKGENAAATHEQRRTFGPVQVLDPFGVSGVPSACFNPVALLMAGDMQVTDAQMMADALVQGEEDHWTSSARGLLTGLLLHVATGPDVTTRDLPTVRGLLMRDLPATLEAMTKNTAGPQEVRDVGEWGLTAAAEEWASIVSNAIEQTKWLASPQIQKVLSDGGEQVDFARFRESVQSVYVCLPAPYFHTFAKWLRLVVSAGLDALTKKLNPDMPYPTRFVLDEVAQLGNLEKIETALTLSAGYGVQLWGIWQHLKDIERCYPKSGVAGWVSSSGARLVFATQDNDSVRYFAGMTGEAMTEADIRHMGPGQMLCLIDGQNPLIVDRVPGPDGVK